MAKVQNHKKVARLSPLECELCGYNDRCIFGLARDDLLRLGFRIRFEHCALYNGDRVFMADHEVEPGV